MEELRRCPANIHVLGRDRGPGVGREVGRMNSLETEQVGGPCAPPFLLLPLHQPVLRLGLGPRRRRCGF